MPVWSREARGTDQDQGLFCKAWSYEEMAEFWVPIPAFWRKQRNQNLGAAWRKEVAEVGCAESGCGVRGIVSASLPVRVSSPEATGLSLECPPEPGN